MESGGFVILGPLEVLIFEGSPLVDDIHDTRVVLFSLSLSQNATHGLHDVRFGGGKNQGVERGNVQAFVRERKRRKNDGGFLALFEFVGLHAADVQTTRVRRKLGDKLVQQVLAMLTSVGEHQHTSVLLQFLSNSVENQVVSFRDFGQHVDGFGYIRLSGAVHRKRIVLRTRKGHTLDGHLFLSLALHLEQNVSQKPVKHFRQSVLAFKRCGQTQDVSRVNLGEHLRKGTCTHVMGLVDDGQPKSSKVLSIVIFGRQRL